MQSGVLVPDEEGCARILRAARWPNGVVTCVECGSRKVVKDGARDYCQKYRCSACNHYFNDKSGTIFQDTKVPLAKWFEIGLMIESDKPVSEISRDVEISYRNAYYIAKKLRESGEFRVGEVLRRERPSVVGTEK